MRATLGLFLAVSLLSTALAASSLPSQTLSHGPTTLISGLPGFTVLDNVWYRNRTFCELLIFQKVLLSGERDDRADNRSL